MTHDELKHQPVLLSEILRLLKVRQNEWYLDATLGGGGHTSKVLQSGGKVVAIDRDFEVIRRAQTQLSGWLKQDRLRLIQGSFGQLEQLVKQAEVDKFAGILFDLGISSLQLDNSERGFSFRHTGPLDMRMDQTQSLTAAKIVNHYSARQLTKLFTQLADEPKARAIAHEIVHQRAQRPILSTTELAKLVVNVYGGREQVHGRHPATRVFMALRMVVNQELDQLIAALPVAWQYLSVSGRLAVISFHSGEDRIVKHFFQHQTRLKPAKLITPKPLLPSEQEVQLNPRARSAKLRVIEKLAN